MFNRNDLAAFVALFALVAVSLGCKAIGDAVNSAGSSSSGEFKSAADGFSVVFPGGAGGVEEEDADVKFASKGRTYGKSFDNRSDNYRSYEVKALELDSYQYEDKDEREILLIGLNGWDTEPETVVKDVTINGKKAVDSLRTIELGPAKMTFREVVLWSPEKKKLYVMQVATSKKENASAQEANDFVNSFRIAE